MLTCGTGRAVGHSSVLKHAWAAWDSGRPVEPRNFNRSFVTASERTGVRLIPVHATRKTCASLLVALDVHPRVAMQVLRHSQISVTMDVYAEVSSEATRRALKRLSKRLDGRR
jgi:integrase